MTKQAKGERGGGMSRPTQAVIDASKEEMILRRLLWLRHGCESPALYGDDGEMQCNKCVIDFKRNPVAYIERRFYEIGFLKMKEYIEGVDKNETN